jgi:hypothetical protein
MDRRHHPRIKMDYLSVDINDGIKFFQGKTTDISRNGLCMEELSKHLRVETDKLTVVVSGGRDHFRLVVRPKWYISGTLVKSIGAEILTSSWMWQDFVSRLEPLSEDYDFSEFSA